MMEQKGIKIIYENKDFIVILKPEGILTIKGRGSLSFEKTVVDYLREKYHQIFVVHRLDKDTSGIILFAKNKTAHKNFSSKFEKREIKKFYLVLVYGNIKEDFFEIKLPLREYSSGRVGICEEKGKMAITQFKVLKRFENYTLLEASPITGKRHQIRVHLYARGHPVVGDKFYGDIKRQMVYPRMMLHSYKIEFDYERKKYIFENHGSFYDDLNKILNEKSN